MSELPHPPLQLPAVVPGTARQSPEEAAAVAQSDMLAWAADWVEARNPGAGDALRADWHAVAYATRRATTVWVPIDVGPLTSRDRDTLVAVGVLLALIDGELLVAKLGRTPDGAWLADARRLFAGLAVQPVCGEGCAIAGVALTARQRELIEVGAAALEVIDPSRLNLAATEPRDAAWTRHARARLALMAQYHPAPRAPGA